MNNLTWREYFALEILKGMLASHHVYFETEVTMRKNAAQAVQFAEILMEELYRYEQRNTKRSKRSK